jgi:murein L,D-transpeptidase YcbB/YkuD
MIPTSHKALKWAMVALLASPFWAGAQELSLHVNLPAYRLDVLRGEQRIRSYPIAIGARDFETPIGAFDVRYIEWNPWWNPPDSPWAKDEKRTPPGPSNPMGRAKIEFLPLFYIHGSREPLERAVSHGCIRMANDDVLELAELLAKEAGADVSAAEIAALERDPDRTHHVRLPDPVRVHVVYRLVEEIDGKVHVYDDVYEMGMSSQEQELARGRSNGR